MYILWNHQNIKIVMIEASPLGVAVVEHRSKKLNHRHGEDDTIVHICSLEILFSVINAPMS